MLEGLVIYKELRVLEFGMKVKGVFYRASQNLPSIENALRIIYHQANQRSQIYIIENSKVFLALSYSFSHSIIRSFIAAVEESINLSSALKRSGLL